MTELHPTAIYFIQRPSEYASFVGHLCRIAAFGYTLGVDIMFVGKNLPENAPGYFHRPGLWVEYSDKSVKLVGG